MLSRSSHHPRLVGIPKKVGTSLCKRAPGFMLRTVQYIRSSHLPLLTLNECLQCTFCKPNYRYVRYSLPIHHSFSPKCVCSQRSSCSAPSPPAPGHQTKSTFASENYFTRGLPGLNLKCVTDGICLEISNSVKKK